MSELEVAVASVEDLLKLPLIIPSYQRPYRWTKDNVLQLLEDISTARKTERSTYRIGSVIIYNDKNSETLEIVDGQQRITTILLLLMSQEHKAESHLINSLKYSHIDSKNNIISNYDYLKQWFQDYSEPVSLLRYLLNKCTFVVIKTNDLSEAFQMFDSQNGRGKELEAYNLIKAYHMQEMYQNNPSHNDHQKINCDIRWEDAVHYRTIKNNKNIDILYHLFNEQLYRTRIWSRKFFAWQFNKTKINEFKGLAFSTEMPTALPFQYILYLEYLSKESKFFEMTAKNFKRRYETIDNDHIDVFAQINQSIINGKHFFDYIETYTALYKEIFLDNNEKLLEFRKFYEKYCCNYKGHTRIGDIYLKELFKSAMFLLYDRFGTEIFLNYYKTIYSIIYRLRLELQKIQYVTVAKYPVEKYQIFHIIQYSKDTSDLKILIDMKNEPINDCRLYTETITEFFISSGIEISSNDEDTRKKIRILKKEIN